MSLTISSTTSPDSDLQHAVSDQWRTPPPAKPEETAPSKGESIPLEKLPPKKFNEVRDQQVEEKRFGHRGGGYAKRIDKLTARHHAAEDRAIAAENRVKELEARLNGAAPAQAQPAQASNASPSKPAESQSAPQQPAAQPRQEQPQPKALTPHQQRLAQGRAKYADFDAALVEADRSGFMLPTQEAEEALKAMPNSAEFMYAIAKNPQLREGLSRQISANPQQAADLIQRVGAVMQLEAWTDRASWESFNARIAELKSNKDFNPRLLLDLPEFLRPAITGEGRLGADVLQHLGRNPQLAREISQMRPDAALKRLGQLCGQLGPKPKVKPLEPITPVGKSSTATASVPLDQLPPQEYNRIMNKREMERRRGR